MQMTELEMNPNKLVQHLDKLPEEFTKADIIKFIEDNKIEVVNFRYIGGDTKLKTHPDMVAFQKLGKKEQEKDWVFFMLCKIAKRIR